MDKGFHSVYDFNNKDLEVQMVWGLGVSALHGSDLTFDLVLREPRFAFQFPEHSCLHSPQMVCSGVLLKHFLLSNFSKYKCILCTSI